MSGNSIEVGSHIILVNTEARIYSKVLIIGQTDEAYIVYPSLSTHPSHEIQRHYAQESVALDAEQATMRLADNSIVQALTLLADLPSHEGSIIPVSVIQKNATSIRDYTKEIDRVIDYEPNSFGVWTKRE